MYEIAFSDGIFSKAVKIIGPIMGRKECLERFQKEFDNNTTGKKLFWGRWEEIPRDPNCFVEAP